MENSNSKIKELCYIYHKRNLLGRQRDSLRHKYRYLQDIKRAMQVRDNFEASDVYKKAYNKSRYAVTTTTMKPGTMAETIAKTRSLYLYENPIPKRFKDLKLRDINLMLLEAEAKVCNSKAKIMRHTHKYDKALKNIGLRYSPRYSCGIVTTLYIARKDEHDDWVTDRSLNATEIKRYHDEFIADKAIDKMLKG